MRKAYWQILVGRYHAVKMYASFWGIFGVYVWFYEEVDFPDRSFLDIYEVKPTETLETTTETSTETLDETPETIEELHQSARSP